MSTPKQQIDDRDILLSTALLVDVRGPSGKLYGRLNRETLVIEVKRKNEPPELIDLKPLLQRS